MNKKNNEGITLIALVITIIILLILAGLSIQILASENGLINRTISAKDYNHNQGIKEQIEMLMDEYIIDSKTGTININDNNQIATWLGKMKQNGRMDDYTFDSNERIIGITIDGITLFYDANGEEVKIIVYNIDYELNGGTNEANPIRSYRKGDSINLPVPTKVNAQFIGWSTKSDNYDSENIISNIKSDMEGDIKLYACWIDELSNDLFTFTTTTNSATITGFSEKGIQKYDNGEITSLVLPSKDGNGLKVTAVGVNAFSGKDKIEKLIIPETVATALPWQSFSGCSKIKYLKMPISLSYEWSNAFDGVTNIEEIYFSKGTGIGVNYVDNSAQQGHYTYTPWAKSSAKLTKITLEKGITSIGNNIFRGCNNITDTWENLINTREELTNIGSCAFCGCNKITGELSFPSGITKINTGTFLNCTGITRLIIPETITTNLSWQAFAGCSGVKYLKIPISLTYEAHNAFDGVTNIEEIYFSKGTGIGINYVDNSAQQGHYTYTPWAKSSAKLTKVTLEKGITSVGNNMFRGCSNITDTWENLINTREELTNIGSCAFCGCNKITGELTFPSGITKINTGTFLNCTGITSLIIPETVTNAITWQAFAGCSGVKFLRIPISLSYDYHNAFDGVTNIEEIYFSKGTGVGVNYVDNSAQQNHYTYTPWGKSSANLTKVTLEKGITSVGNNMFRGCCNIIDTWENLINTREELTNIGSYAFCGCNKITGELTFPSGITKINTGTFLNCTGITRLIIPDTVTNTLTWQAFAGDSGIKYLKMPISLSYEWHNAFDGVTNIEEVYFSKGTGVGVDYANNSAQQNHYTYTPWGKSAAKLTKVTFEKGVASVGNLMFYGNNKISEVHYTGTSGEWALVTIGSNNDNITKLTVQCSN